MLRKKVIDMKRIVLSICAIMCALSLSAQKFYEITSVQALPNGMDFEVSAGAQKLKVNKFDYQAISARPQAFFLVIYTGEKAAAITIARKSACQYVISEVLSVEPTANGKWLLKLASGLNYTSSNQDWGTVQPGQHVGYSIVDGETKGIIRKPHTVDREVALTNEVPVSPSPSAPIIILDEENKIVGVNL